MADWSLLQTPNFAQAALSGYQAGAAIGKQNRISAALQGADLTKPETLVPLFQADPTTGAAALTASTAFAKAQTDAAGRAALGTYLATLQPGQAPHQGAVQALVPGAPAIGPSGMPSAEPDAGADVSETPSLTAGSGLSPATGAPSATDPSGSIVVTGHPQPAQLDPVTVARLNYMKADPEGYIKTETALAGMTKAQRESADSVTGAFDSGLQGLKTIPESNMAGRQAYIQAHRGDWVTAGVPSQMIDGFVPTDANIADEDNRTLGFKGMIEKQDKDRSFGLDQQKFGETQRHDQVDESQGSAHIGIDQENASTSRAHLALDQQTAAQKPGGTGGPVIRHLSNGVTAYQNPANGKWYDNQGFK